MRARRTAKRVTAAWTVGLLLLGLLTAFASSASADTAPVDPAVPTTVSADALPTVQINGVIWAQVVVGNRVYVTGRFTQARPAGSAPGANQTPRSNILAFDLTTGALVTTWAPSLNAQGMTIAASPDGARIYVAGDFTQVNGVARGRIAALDANTGALLNSFTNGVNSQVRAIAVAGNTVYAGGNFTVAGGQTRQRLAAFDGGTGAVLPWAPTAEQEVLSMTAPPDSGKIVVGGRFTLLNGAQWYGLGALDATTAGVLPWGATSVVRNAGPNAGIWYLTSDINGVYGTGYTFGTGGNFEGSFAAEVGDGALRWVVGCRGDTYGAAPIGSVLYTVGHPHDCSQIGEFPQTNPWTYQRAMATTIDRSADGRTNVSGPFLNRPAPEMLHWLPTLPTGSFTGQFQAAWAVAATSQYVVLGGEFPSVNGVAQQGLARFTLRQGAPNQQGPQGAGELAPTLQGIDGTGVRISWTAAWDRDNRRLSYEVLRGANVGSATVVGRVDADSTWYGRGRLAVVDAGAPPGSTQTYRIRVRDPLNNTVVGGAASGAVPGAAVGASAYRDNVVADGANNYWRLGEAGGTSALNLQGADDLTLAATALRNQPGAIGGDPNTATGFLGGGTNVPATTTGAREAPQTFSVEAWFRTTTLLGGKIVGYGNSSTGASTAHDRHIYMTNTGELIFGVNPGTPRTVTSPNRYNDGNWHHAVGTLGTNGLRLYVDGQLVGQLADVTRAQDYNGVWRIGGDNLTSPSPWPTVPTNRNFQGSIDEVATYLAPLSAQQVLAHWQRAAGQVPNTPPAASFTSTPSGLTVSFNGSGSTDPDGTITGHAWNFGDNQTGTGATPSHTYAAAGTYQVTLTVTDDDGATGATTQSVTVSPPGQPGVFAADTFSRTVSSGLGSADTGGAWTLANTASNYAVSDGAGRFLQPAAAAQRAAYLNSVAQTATDLGVTVAVDKAATGGGTYVTVVGRRVGTSGSYRARLRFLAGGAVSVDLLRESGGAETNLGTATAPGITYAPGEQLRVRTQISGTGTTNLMVKVWRQGTAEPAAWLLTRTDTTAALQAPGAVGLITYLSSSATNAPVTVSFDDLTASAPPTP